MFTSNYLHQIASNFSNPVSIRKIREFSPNIKHSDFNYSLA